MDNSNLEHSSARNVRTVGAVVATVCVMGLIGALWLHPDHQGTQFAGTTQVGPAVTPASTETDFLRASATASAIPSADEVFASRRGTSEDDAPAAPTF